MADIPFSDFARSQIKSVQRGVASVTTSAVDITVSAVNMSKSVLIINKAEPSASDAAVFAALTSSTNIQIQRISSNTSARSVAWQLLEYS